MSQLLTTTPRADGFRMPGAIEAKTRCWMIWPERTDEWPNGAKPAQRAYARVATAIAKSDPVTMAVSARQFKTRGPCCRRTCASSKCRTTTRGCVTADRTSSSMIRPVKSGASIGSSNPGAAFTFPGTGMTRVARKVLDIEGLDRYRAPIVAEGGALQCDGQGTLITTSQCLLNANRKVGPSDAEIGQADRLSERRQDNLAAARVSVRYNGWAYRRPGRVRETRGGSPDLDGGQE